jgi:predicted MPP superfamily phosphohydrolase
VHRLPILASDGSDHGELRIGFASDLHLGPTTPARLLDNAFEHLSAAKLDLLLLGGDYVFLDATEALAAELAFRVKGVPATRKFAVLGNHDLWTHHPRIERALAGAGVELLINRSETVRTRSGDITVVGLDEPWTGNLDVAPAWDGANGVRTHVVLCHSPDGLPPAQEAIRRMRPAPTALYVCGHTHGGHIATPWGPVIVPGRVGKRYPSGLHDLGTLQLYVSRGLGGIELPVRSYAKPEVAIFELTPRAARCAERPSRGGALTPVHPAR